MGKSKRVTNTTRDENHPEWVRGGNPRAIEAQEKRGQAELVNSEALPFKGSQTDCPKLIEAGVKFGPKLADDPLFCEAVLPKGWKKRATDHDMWSELVDDKGVVRASIFYKAAFYDRKAFIRDA